jgi:hypothetical protein
MSPQKAQESLASVENLIHAVAGIQHVEEAYLQKRLEYKMVAHTMPPVESRLNEAKAKTYVLFEGFVVDQVMLLMCCVQGNLESHQERPRDLVFGLGYGKDYRKCRVICMMIDLLICTVYLQLCLA